VGISVLPGSPNECLGEKSGKWSIMIFATNDEITVTIGPVATTTIPPAPTTTVPPATTTTDNSCKPCIKVVDADASLNGHYKLQDTGDNRCKKDGCLYKKNRYSRYVLL